LQEIREENNTNVAFSLLGTFYTHLLLNMQNGEVGFQAKKVQGSAKFIDGDDAIIVLVKEIEYAAVKVNAISVKM
jgi:hypothetical protein